MGKVLRRAEFYGQEAGQVAVARGAFRVLRSRPDLCPNRLHFYIVDLKRDKAGILSHTLAVRSLDGSKPQQRGTALETRSGQKAAQSNAPVVFTLKNTGTAAATDPAIHPADDNAFLKSDVYRPSVSVDGKGWTAQLLNGLAAVESGASQQVTVYVSQQAGSAASAKVTLKAVSESGPSKSATATATISK